MTPVEKDPAKGLNGALAAEMRAEISVQRRTNLEVSETAGVDRVSFQRYVNAKRPINTATAEAICNALGVDAGAMYARAVSRLSAAAPNLPRVADSNVDAQAEAEAQEQD